MGVNPLHEMVGDHGAYLVSMVRHRKTEKEYYLDGELQLWSTTGL
jgi:hypothetical protein